jgi:hypothetical protein
MNWANDIISHSRLLQQNLPIADMIKRLPNEAAYRRAMVIATARTISQESAPIHPAESASHSNAPLGKRLKPNQLKPISSEERTSTLTF